MGTTDKERRNFFIAGIYGLWALIAAAFTAPAVAYLLLPPRARRQQDWIEVASVKDLQPGTPEEIVFRTNRIDGWKVTSEKATAWVVRKGEAEVIAFMPQCTHLGCAYHWDRDNKEFLCPCHTSTFDLDGQVRSGPAPRPLDRFQVKIESGKLLLGKGESAEA